MAHEIEGNKAFFVSEPAWHGLGVVLQAAPNAAEAAKLAYPHLLREKPIYYGSNLNIASHKAIVRDDNLVLGIVGKGYELFQPHESFTFFQPWLDTGRVKLEAGGSLKGGKRMWALASLDTADAEVAPGDRVRGYFLVYTSFDGSLAHGLKFVSERVVCANTLAVALRESGPECTVRHTTGMHAKIERIQASLDMASQKFGDSTKAYAAMAKKKITKAKAEEFIRYVILPNGKVGTEISTRSENKVDELMAMLDKQRGSELVPTVRGTVWEAYNAVTEYLTHEHGRNQDTRLNAQWFGGTADLNVSAFQAAMAMTQ
jgi:phage/plasmid-like protein (TIGR03299 family)